MWKGWVNGLLGLWLIVEAFLNFNATAIMWNNIIVGIIVAIVAILMIKEKPWQGWLGLIVGLWVLIAGFIPGLRDHTANLWNALISGILIAIAGFFALGKGEKES